ncbi:MAG: mannitol dehydrogenase family protein [Propionibacteriaceae bacterium]|jgi:fructuronate reductase|nr:mannitol dehydrogenase family protein [Propionibacteriaceae bacterium]
MTTDHPRATLDRASCGSIRLIGASAPPVPGIVHLGLGQFHRAHAAFYTALAMQQDMGEWGIAGVANRSRRVVEALQAQDGLYSLLELDQDEVSFGLIDVHRQLLVAADQPAEVAAAIAASTTRLITLTLTEAGYHSGADGHLGVDQPDVAADLSDPRHPRTLLGILAAGLWSRWEHDQPAPTVLCCDNLLAAGEATRARVFEYLDAAGAPVGLHDWLAAAAFPNAMVDRIVPGTTDATRETAARLLGLRDRVPVPTEPFSMWVIEDNFALGRPSWEQAGVIFSDQVADYELIKLRLLNGCHSLMATLGVLSGLNTIPEAIANATISACVRQAQRDEYGPTLTLPDAFDLAAYEAELFHRWGNTALGDATTRVASDGSLKLAQRVVDPAIAALDRGEMPQQLALTVAAWLVMVAPPTGFDPGPLAKLVVEPKAQAMARLVAGAISPAEHARRVMAGGILPDRLCQHQEFTDRVAELVTVLSRHGVAAAMAEAIG